MSPLIDLHHDPAHRRRQLRWALTAGLLLLAAAAITLGVLYGLASRDVGTEFFHAHKTIANTGTLLRRGVLGGAAALVVVVAAIVWWTLRVNHRVVRPVHAIHEALTRLAGGDLGVRLELDRADEFQEVGAELNRLATEFATMLREIHGLADRVDALAQEAARGDRGSEASRELRDVAAQLNRAMDFFRLEPETRIDGRP